MSEKTHEQFKLLVESYREFADAVGLPLETVEEALKRLASQYSGCVSCVFSRAHKEINEREIAEKGRLSLFARNCALGLRQETCGMHQQIPK